LERILNRIGLWFAVQDKPLRAAHRLTEQAIAHLVLVVG
jgi:hypothetical protein